MTGVTTPARTDLSAARAVFVRLWAGAVLLHLVGNPHFGALWPSPEVVGIIELLLGIVAAVVFVFPRGWILPALMAVFVVASVAAEAPVVGNHWLVAGFVSILWLATSVRADPVDAWRRFAPGGRWILLGFYVFAAFAKLNAGFFDPVASCAVFYANQMLAAAGLPMVQPGSVLAAATAWGTTAIELAVPVLLLSPRLRRWGILLALTFHGFLTLDLAQHFFDFTSVLFALFLLFAGDDGLVAVGETLGRWARATRIPPRLAKVSFLPIALVFVVAGLLPVTTPTVFIVRSLIFLLWIPAGGAVVAASFLSLPRRPTVGLRIGPAAVVIVALVVFNGLTPYLELKTGTAYNMYANLVTAGGKSNHFIVRATLPLTDGNFDPVVILDSDDPGLQMYVGSGLALPWPQFADYLAERPEATATFVRRGETTTVRGADLPPDADRPWWRERFQVFRAIDLSDPPACQVFWYPAN